MTLHGVHGASGHEGGATFTTAFGCQAAQVTALIVGEATHVAAPAPTTALQTHERLAIPGSEDEDGCGALAVVGDDVGLGAPAALTADCVIGTHASQAVAAGVGEQTLGAIVDEIVAVIVN